MIIKEFHLKISRASETLGPALAMFSGRVSQKSPFSTLFLCNSWITQSDPVLQIYNPCSFKLLLFLSVSYFYIISSTLQGHSTMKDKIEEPTHDPFLHRTCLSGPERGNNTNYLGIFQRFWGRF